MKKILRIIFCTLLVSASSVALAAENADRKAMVKEQRKAAREAAKVERESLSDEEFVARREAKKSAMDERRAKRQASLSDEQRTEIKARRAKDGERSRRGGKRREKPES